MPKGGGKGMGGKKKPPIEMGNNWKIVPAGSPKYSDRYAPTAEQRTAVLVSPSGKTQRLRTVVRDSAGPSAGGGGNTQPKFRTRTLPEPKGTPPSKKKKYTGDKTYDYKRKPPKPKLPSTH